MYSLCTLIVVYNIVLTIHNHSIMYIVLTMHTHSNMYIVNTIHTHSSMYIVLTIHTHSSMYIVHTIHTHSNMYIKERERELKTDEQRERRESYWQEPAAVNGLTT